MFNQFKTLLFIFCFIIFVNDLSATVKTVSSSNNSISGYEVMKRVADQSKKKQTRKAIVDMKIFDDQGRKRVRHFNYWTKFKDDEESSLIKFFQPKNVKGTSLLTKTDKAKDSKKQWFYLPALKTIKRLSSSDKNKSFMGSDFTYSDIAGRKLSQDHHELIKETESHFYVESTPKNDEKSIYSRLRYVVSKKYDISLKVIFYDKAGKKLKTLNNTKISKINDVYVVMHSEMTNHKTKGNTVLTVQSMEVGLDIKDMLLSIQGLKSQ